MASPYFSNVLVFGATGKVGSVVALEIHSSGARITMALRDVSQPNKWICPDQEHAAGLQRVTADLTDPAAVARAVRQTGA